MSCTLRPTSDCKAFTCQDDWIKYLPEYELLLRNLPNLQEKMYNSYKRQNRQLQRECKMGYLNKTNIHSTVNIIAHLLVQHTNYDQVLSF